MFSSFLDFAGGIQASARLAWRAIAGREGSAADFFCYGRIAPGESLGARRAVVASGKLRAIVAAAARPWAVDAVILWHASLARLLPFFHFLNSDGLRRPRVTVFLHGTEIDALAEWPARRLLRVDRFLTNSEVTWKRFAAVCSSAARRPHHIVPLGIGEAAGSVGGERRCAAVILGRMEKGEDYKGHRELIEAWVDVRRHVPGAELWIVGDGGLRLELEAVAASRCPDGVRFWGWVPEEDKERLLRSARCLAMPSRGEGFGLAYLEAMRVGTPCLVSTLDAGREVVAPPEAGLAVNPRSTGDLVEALCRLLSPSLQWDAWSEGARRRYESRFTARHFQERLLEALDS